jgi:hypothetical protein
VQSELARWTLNSESEVALRQCRCEVEVSSHTVTSRVAAAQQFDLRENDAVLILLKPLWQKSFTPPRN